MKKVFFYWTNKYLSCVRSFTLEISGPEVPLRRGGAARGLLRALHLDPGPSEDLLELEIRQATLWTQLQLRGGRLNGARFNLGSTLKVEVSLGLTFARCEPSLTFSPVENQAATLQYHRIRWRVVSQVWFEIVLNSFFLLYLLLEKWLLNYHSTCRRICCWFGVSGFIHNCSFFNAILFSRMEKKLVWNSIPEVLYQEPWCLRIDLNPS